MRRKEPFDPLWRLFDAPFEVSRECIYANTHTSNGVLIDSDPFGSVKAYAKEIGSPVCETKESFASEMIAFVLGKDTAPWARAFLSVHSVNETLSNMAAQDVSAEDSSTNVLLPVAFSIWEEQKNVARFTKKALKHTRAFENVKDRVPEGVSVTWMVFPDEQTEALAVVKRASQSLLVVLYEFNSSRRVTAWLSVEIPFSNVIGKPVACNGSSNESLYLKALALLQSGKGSPGELVGGLGSAGANVTDYRGGKIL